MRNDFPDHPAGPLKSPPNVSEVIEIQESRAGVAVVALIAVVPALILGIALLFSREEFQLMGGVVTLFSVGALYYMYAASSEGTPVIRIRPDGIEFLRDETPPLHWHDIASINLGVMNVIGGGGAHDYLGIKLNKGLKYPSRGSYTGALNKMVGQWDFDLCYGGDDFNRPVVHVIMEMRARAEAAAGVVPQSPPGLTPIKAGAIAAYAAQLEEEGIGGGILSWAGYIFGGLLAIAGSIGGGDAAIKLSNGMSHVVRADGTQGDAYSMMVVKGLVMFAVGVFIILSSRSKK
jgi:hypothetical protein